MYAIITQEDKTTTVLVCAAPDSLTASMGMVGNGAARCRPGDIFSPKIGTLIATGRAIADFGQKVAAAAEARAVTEEELLRVLAVLSE